MRVVAFKDKINNRLKVVIALSSVLLVICVIVAGVLIFGNNDSSSNTNNKAVLLKNAQKALSEDPNNVDKILTVAYLSSAENPSAAKKYYVQAFDKFKQQNNPDLPGKSAVTYWAAAGLAKQAGEINQAKMYYQEVIQVARPSDSYEQSLAEQSKADLVSLQ